MTKTELPKVWQCRLHLLAVVEVAHVGLLLSDLAPVPFLRPCLDMPGAGPISDQLAPASRAASRAACTTNQRRPVSKSMSCVLALAHRAS
jgi:hypothetical protein